MKLFDGGLKSVYGIFHTFFYCFIYRECMNLNKDDSVPSVWFCREINILNDKTNQTLSTNKLKIVFG